MKKKGEDELSNVQSFHLQQQETGGKQNQTLQKHSIIARTRFIQTRKQKRHDKDANLQSYYCALRLLKWDEGGVPARAQLKKLEAQHEKHTKTSVYIFSSEQL